MGGHAASVVQENAFPGSFRELSRFSVGGLHDAGGNKMPGVLAGSRSNVSDKLSGLLEG